jgi:NitT/TauT family transport system ATP-binding protein
MTRTETKNTHYPPEPIIRLDDVTLCYPGQHRPVLDQVNFSIHTGEVVAIVGKSGCGKTSLLQLISGLQQPTSGSVHLFDEQREGVHTDVSYVFQKPVLLEWRNLWSNILLPGELRGLADSKTVPNMIKQSNREDTSERSTGIYERAMELLHLVGLEDWVTHYPSQLSGGMLSRAALVRAILLEPTLLLMDEPFAALDAITREQLQSDLLMLLQRYNITAVFVTHDIGEAVYLADRILLLGDSSEHRLKEFRISLVRPRTSELRFSQSFTDHVREIYRELQIGGDNP